MDLNEMIYGSDYSQKLKEFEDELSSIEERNMDFFVDREPKFPADDHDRLHNHWMMIKDGNRVQFGFEDDSEVPYEVQDECVLAFKRIFSND